MKKKVLSLLLIAAVAMGGGTSLTASAASGAHAATKCRYVDTYTCDDWYTWRCSGGTTESCPGGPLSGYEEDYYCDDCGAYEMTCWDWSCDTCGARVSYGWSDSNHNCPVSGINGHSSGASYSNPHNSIKVECEHGKMSSHTVTEECSHGYSRNHTQTDYHNCSSSYPCQNGHTSYRTVNHYYCTTHGYVGTSSTCPGLTVSPSPSPLSIYYGQTKRLSANQMPTTASVTLTSQDTSIVTIDSNGTCVGIKPGTTTITVTATL